MKRFASIAAVAALTAGASSAFGVAVTVDKTGILNPNPNNLAITEVGNTSLAAARTLLAGAHTANTGGVVDFQQRNQGGTFINSTAANNGVNIGDGVANSIYVAGNAGPVGDGLVGTPIFSFYRGETAAGDAFDSNLDQGGNIISGGFQSRYPGAVSPSNPSGDGSAVVGVNSAYGAAIPGNISGGYFGIAGTGSPATIVFGNQLSFFGLTALPRGSNRNSTFTFTLSDLSTAVISADVTTSAVFFGYTAPVGLGITKVAITNATTVSVPGGPQTGQNRYDDLAFVLVPEPASVALLGLGGLAMIARRRKA